MELQKKAKRDDYYTLTDEYTAHINARRKYTNIMTKDFNTATLKAVAETIPNGARRNYRPYWTEEEQPLESYVNVAREKKTTST